MMNGARIATIGFQPMASTNVRRPCQRCMIFDGSGAEHPEVADVKRHAVSNDNGTCIRICGGRRVGYGRVVPP